MSALTLYESKSMSVLRIIYTIHDHIKLKILIKILHIYYINSAYYKKTIVPEC